MRYISINYGGAMATINLSSNGSLHIGDSIWTYNISADGVVSLNVANVTEDIVLNATSTSIQNSDRYIVTNSDSNSSITHDNENIYNWNNAVTVKVAAKSGYTLSGVSFQLGTRVVNVKPQEKTFVLNGKTYNVNWVSDSECSVYFSVVPGLSDGLLFYGRNRASRHYRTRNNRGHISSRLHGRC